MDRPRINETGWFGWFDHEYGHVETQGKAVIVSDEGCTLEEEISGTHYFFVWDDFSYFIRDDADEDVFERYIKGWEANSGKDDII